MCVLVRFSPSLKLSHQETRKHYDPDSRLSNGDYQC
nr:MAG TPA: hypothetical protein [Caudoviricetes sp.]